jgi:hypothetical protein
VLRLLNQGLEILELKFNVFLGLLWSLKGLTPKGEGPNVGVGSPGSFFFFFFFAPVFFTLLIQQITYKLKNKKNTTHFN